MFFATKFKIFSQVFHAMWSYGKHRKSVIFLMKIFVKNFSHGKQTFWVFFCLVSSEPSYHAYVRIFVEVWFRDIFSSYDDFWVNLPFLNLHVPVIKEKIILRSVREKRNYWKNNYENNSVLVLGCSPSCSIVFTLIMFT